MIRTVPRSTAAAPNRGGAAAVEFAFAMMFVLFPLMVGIWEVGRAVQVQQMVASAAREGARLAAQGRTTTNTGAQLDIRAVLAAGSTSPSVKAAVVQSLAGSGLKNVLWSDVTVTFAFTDGNMASTEPYQGAKNQGFTVTVVLNYTDRVRWSNIGGFGITSLTSTSKWRMLVDDPFTVNPNVPNW